MADSPAPGFVITIEDGFALRRLIRQRPEWAQVSEALDGLLAPDYCELLDLIASYAVQPETPPTD
jgi:hypothetical protein